MDHEAEDKAFKEALEKGIQLFNERKFFEAYEVWEERWNYEMSEGADLLQGLLQMAVGFAKLTGGNPKGTSKLLGQSVDKLMMYAPSAYDLDVDALIALVKHWQGVVEQMVEQGVTQLPELPSLGKSGEGQE